MAGWIGLLSLMLLVLGAGSARPQSLMSGHTLTVPYGEDERRADELRTTGERRQGRWVLLFTPTGTDDPAEDALLVQLDNGVAALYRIVGRHDWQVLRTPIITIYVSAERFEPHTYGRGVFVPLERLQHEGPALVLHEAAHDVLRSVAPGDRVPVPFPFWLTEGLADYVTLVAADRAGLRGESARYPGGSRSADAACSTGLKGRHGNTVAPHIGGAGAPSTGRIADGDEVIPLFRACSTSFVKYLVESVGLPAVIGLMPLLSTPPEAASFHIYAVQRKIEQLTGAPLDTLRAEWRAAIDKMV